MYISLFNLNISQESFKLENETSHIHQRQDSAIVLLTESLLFQKTQQQPNPLHPLSQTRCVFIQIKFSEAPFISFDSLKILVVGTGETAQCVNFFPCEHEELCPASPHPPKRVLCDITHLQPQCSRGRKQRFACGLVASQPRFLCEFPLSE